MAIGEHSETVRGTIWSSLGKLVPPTHPWGTICSSLGELVPPTHPNRTLFKPVRTPQAQLGWGKTCIQILFGIHAQLPRVKFLK